MKSIVMCFAAALTATSAFLAAAFGPNRPTRPEEPPPVKVPRLDGTYARDPQPVELGRYLVQLVSIDRRGQDWSDLPVVGGPRPIELRVSSGEESLMTRGLGQWRGRKSFLARPVSFYAIFDGKRQYTIEFAENGGPGPRRTYRYTDAWPFNRRAFGAISTARFTWTREPDVPNVPPPIAEPEEPEPKRTPVSGSK